MSKDYSSHAACNIDAPITATNISVLMTESLNFTLQFRLVLFVHLTCNRSIYDLDLIHLKKVSEIVKT